MPLKWNVTIQLICWGDTFAQRMWAEEGRGGGVRKTGSKRETEWDRKRKTKSESGELTPHNPPFLYFLNRTLNIIITLWSRSIYVILIFNTPFNLQWHKSKKKMPLFSTGTYWQDFFSHVALFLQQLINILSDYLRRGKRQKTHSQTLHWQYGLKVINNFILLLIQIHPTKVN